MATYKIKAKLWLYPGETASWHFLTIPKDISEKIKKAKPKAPRGWGSVRVTAKINTTSWTTSVFPDSKSNTYILPVKASVRSAEALYDEDTVTFAITLL